MIPEGINRLKPVIKPLLPRVISIILLEALCGPPFDSIESVDTAVSLGVTKHLPMIPVEKIGTWTQFCVVFFEWKLYH